MVSLKGELVTSVALIHLATDHITTTATDDTTDYGTYCTIFLIDHRTGNSTTGTTNYSTFGGLTPASFLGGVRSG